MSIKKVQKSDLAQTDLYETTRGGTDRSSNIYRATLC